jgi:hypothetical protein
MTSPRISAALGIAVAALAAALPATASAQDVLPDLDQQVPTGLQVSEVRLGAKTVFRLGFDSAAANVGAGPLRLLGHRASRREPTMRVNQLVEQMTGRSRVVRDVGVMSYVVHPDHKHWHLLGFARYEIRAVGDAGSAPLRRDRKTGFCLGDRYPIHNAAALPGFNPTPEQGDTCGLGRPDLLGLFAGISVGYGDAYAAQLEGQFIDVTGLPAGRYVLAHSVNTDGRLVERDYTNNASSVLFSLSWPDGPRRLPRTRVLHSCPASPTCPVPHPRSPA